MKYRKPLLAALAAASLLTAGSPAIADPTEVKYSTAGNGAYDVFMINEFDWQSSGDLLVENALPIPAIANGASYTNFANWYTNAIPGDTVTFNFHAHARLNDMLSPSGGSVRPATLSRDGATCLAGASCFEVTTALSGQESAMKLLGGALLFFGVSGNYTIYHDTTPDSSVSNTNNVLPTGFTDGTAFLQGSMFAVSGTAVPTGSGNSLVTNLVSTYNANYIQADSATLDTLVGTTFDTLTSQPSTGEARVPVGDPIGLSPYVRLSADILWKADANTEFDAVASEAEGCRMTGGGVDVDGSVILGTLAEDSSDKNRYTFGGQVGAPTASQPQPFGEWTHHQQKGPAGDFVFHAGTHSAPKVTKITEVNCADPGWCIQARPAPYKQLEWKGTGSFRTVKGPMSALVVPDSKANFSTHYFRAFIQDTGEPGAGGKQTSNPSCTAPRFFGDPVNCGENCPDYYYIEIHATADPASEIIYKTEGFIDGGNLQIHPAIK
jgi:hypothetical protein